MNNYIILMRKVTKEYWIEVHDKKGYWKLNVYESGLDEIPESELHWNLQAQFLPLGGSRTK